MSFWTVLSIIAWVLCGVITLYLVIDSLSLEKNLAKKDKKTGVTKIKVERDGQ